jgi:acid phosphatase
VGHHPLFSGGPHGGAPELVKLVKPILDRHRVAIYLGGHDHNMQHVVKDNIHYMTCGTGATLRPARQIDGTVFVAETLGFLRAAISPRSMEVAFVDADGKVLHSAAIAATA